MRISLNTKFMSTLYDLNINKPAKINSLNSSNVFSNRLSEMGVLPGSLVRVVKKNPFGGPIEIKLNNSYLAIRKEDAELILISE